MMWLVSLIGKCLVFLSRRLGGGHGSALPGLVIEKLSPHFLGRLLAKLPEGVVLVSGTNGKTTTTKIIADLLRADGYRVFTNPSRGHLGGFAGHASWATGGRHRSAGAGRSSCDPFRSAG